MWFSSQKSKMKDLTITAHIAIICNEYYPRTNYIVKYKYRFYYLINFFRVAIHDFE